MAKENLQFKIAYTVLMSAYIYLLLFSLQRSTEIIGRKEMEEETIDIFKNHSCVKDIN